MEEYRRFLFRSVVMDHIVTPSEEVDQFWHMQICYTKSYWNELCEKALIRPLHHNQIFGGEYEIQKYRQCYLDSLKSYESYFGALMLAGCASVAVAQSEVPVPVIVIGFLIALVIIFSLKSGGGKGGRGGCGGGCSSGCGSSCGGGCGGD